MTKKLRNTNNNESPVVSKCSLPSVLFYNTRSLRALDTACYGSLSSSRRAAD